MEHSCALQVPASTAWMSGSTILALDIAHPVASSSPTHPSTNFEETSSGLPRAMQVAARLSARCQVRSEAQGP